MKILIFGEVLWDIYPDKKCIGGAALNFAAHCACEGCEVSFLSAVGNDELGEQTIKVIKDFGIDTSFVMRSSKETGCVTVTLDENKIPSYFVHTDTAYDNIEIEPLSIDEMKKKGYSCLYFGTLCQRNTVSRNTLKTVLQSLRFQEIFCDVNLRNDCYDLDSVNRCLSNATILKISDEEEPMLRRLGGYAPLSDEYEDIAKAICKKYKQIKVLILTLGFKGSYAYDNSTGRSYCCDAVPCDVVSTVGAGDSFSAAFVSNYFETKDIKSALEAGAALSSFVVAHTDAVPIR